MSFHRILADAGHWAILGIVLGGVGTPTSLWSREPALETVLARSQALRAEGGTPIVVMDLDETVVDSQARRLWAFRESMTGLCGEIRSGSCGQIAGVNLLETYDLPNRYDLTALWDRIGVRRDAWRERLQEGMLKHYLSGAAMELDQAVPGASEYVRELRGSGATVFFVSSRWESKQGEGTWKSLLHLGMATSDRDRDYLILRPDGQSSIDFKRASFDRIEGWTRQRGGEVIGVFENEPENMNAMVERFPRATPIFVRGAWLRDEPLKGRPKIIVDYR